MKKLKINLKKEGLVVYNDFGRYWVSKVICENPFYGDGKIEKSLSAHKTIVINLIDHHPLEMEKNYYLNKFEIVYIPYGNFPFYALQMVGNW